jgi:hypothetical protein
MNVTRDVIRDLWSLAAAGEASDDSRHLVDAYLAQDAEFARSLRSEAGVLAPPPLELPADHEAKTFGVMKKRLDRRSPVRVVALGFTGLAILRLVQQTTFVSSPKEVIWTSVAAGVLWVVHAWHTRYLLRRGVFGGS